MTPADDLSLQTLAAGLSYQIVLPDIHEFRFSDASLPTLNAFYERLGEIMQPLEPEHPPRLLLYAAPQMPPLTQLMRLNNQLQVKLQYPPVIQAAVVYEGRFQIGMINLVAAALNRRHQVRFFAYSQRDEALRWLHSF